MQYKEKSNVSRSKAFFSHLEMSNDSFSIFARDCVSGQKSHNFQISAMDLPSVPHSPSCLDASLRLKMSAFSSFLADTLSLPMLEDYKSPTESYVDLGGEIWVVLKYKPINFLLQ